MRQLKIIYRNLYSISAASDCFFFGLLFWTSSYIEDIDCFEKLDCRVTAYLISAYSRNTRRTNQYTTVIENLRFHNFMILTHPWFLNFLMFCYSHGILGLMNFSNFTQQSHKKIKLNKMKRRLYTQWIVK